jgi:hypothetical protein
MSTTMRCSIASSGSSGERATAIATLPPLRDVNCSVSEVCIWETLSVPRLTWNDQGERHSRASVTARSGGHLWSLPHSSLVLHGETSHGCGGPKIEGKHMFLYKRQTM